MSTAATDFAVARLKSEFIKVTENATVGGSAVLETLATLAFECCSSDSDRKSAVALALTAVLRYHADDRYERPVSEEHQAFYETFHQRFSNAIRFLENDGTPEEAIRVVSDLSRSLAEWIKRQNTIASPNHPASAGTARGD